MPLCVLLICARHFQVDERDGLLVTNALLQVKLHQRQHFCKRIRKQLNYYRLLSSYRGQESGVCGALTVRRGRVDEGLSTVDAKASLVVQQRVVGGAAVTHHAFNQVLEERHGTLVKTFPLK